MEEKLKTLKELFEEDSFGGFGYRIKEELRAEAVKRAKHWNKRWKQLELLDGKDSYNAGYFKGMCDEAMEANNLTEEDLK